MSFDIKNMQSMQAYQSTQRTQMQTQTQTQVQKQDGTPGEQYRSQVAQMMSNAERPANASVIAHLFNNGQSTEKAGLQISFQEAVDAINKQLREDLGLDASAEDPISQENLKAQGGMEYWTPENTAERLVSGAMAFLPNFQTAHPELEGEALQEKFMEVVGGGLSTGFDQARGFLDDLGVLEGTVADNIDLTYELMNTNLKDRVAEYLGLAPTSTASQTDNVSAAIAEMEVSVTADK